MDLPYLLELLQPLRSMLDFESSAYIRLCTKQLYAARWPLVYLECFAPTIRPLYAPAYSLDWQTAMFKKKQICQLCAQKIAEPDLDFRSGLYGHAQCIIHKKIDQFLTFAEDKALLKDEMRFFKYVPFDRHFHLKARIFTKVRKWLSLDRNIAFLRVYERKEVIKLAFRHNMFLENTVKRKLVQMALEKALGIRISSLYVCGCNWPQMKFNFLEYIEKHTKRVVCRYRALVNELFCIAHLQPAEVQPYIQSNRRAIYNRCFYESIFWYDPEGFNAHQLAVDIVSTVQYGREPAHYNDQYEVAKGFVGPEYYHKRLMRRWRGVARFIGKVIVQRKALEEPRLKRRKI